jgi:AAA+ superfamily predicted ATPase
VAYLLQRIEDFPGIVILATNLQHNIDEAFSRRFQCMIHFTMPGPDERYLLWKQSFPAKMAVPDEEEMRKIAAKYEIAGGGIVNVIRYCALSALSRGAQIITIEDIEKGIRRELVKEGILLA